MMPTIPNPATTETKTTKMAAAAPAARALVRTVLVAQRLKGFKAPERGFPRVGRCPREGSRGRVRLWLGRTCAMRCMGGGAVRTDGAGPSIDGVVHNAKSAVIGGVTYCAPGESPSEKRRVAEEEEAARRASDGDAADGDKTGCGCGWGEASFGSEVEALRAAAPLHRSLFITAKGVVLNPAGKAACRRHHRLPGPDSPTPDGKGLSDLVLSEDEGMREPDDERAGDAGEELSKNEALARGAVFMVKAYTAILPGGGTGGAHGCRVFTEFDARKKRRKAQYTQPQSSPYTPSNESSSRPSSRPTSG